MSQPQEEKWVYSTNDEVFRSEQFDTKEDAIAEAKADLTWEGEHPTFYVGQVQKVDYALGVSVDNILEDISLSVYDEVGEVAEDYLAYVEKPHLQDLEEAMNKVLLEWMTQYGYLPEFYRVVNVEAVRDENELA